MINYFSVLFSSEVLRSGPRAKTLATPSSQGSELQVITQSFLTILCVILNLTSPYPGPFFNKSQCESGLSNIYLYSSIFNLIALTYQ